RGEASREPTGELASPARSGARFVARRRRDRFGVCWSGRALSRGADERRAAHIHTADARSLLGGDARHAAATAPPGRSVLGMAPEAAVTRDVPSAHPSL